MTFFGRVLMELVLAHPAGQPLSVVVEVSDVVTIVSEPDEGAQFDQLFANVQAMDELLAETREMVKS